MIDAQGPWGWREQWLLTAAAPRHRRVSCYTSLPWGKSEIQSEVLATQWHHGKAKNHDVKLSWNMYVTKLPSILFLLNREALSNACCVLRSLCSGWEKGEQSPTPLFLQELSDRLFSSGCFSSHTGVWFAANNHITACSSGAHKQALFSGNPA